jgi:hypothetical protein
MQYIAKGSRKTHVTATSDLGQTPLALPCGRSRASLACQLVRPPASSQPRLFSRLQLRTPHASIPFAAHIMAPLTDSAVDQLKGTVSRLEQRIAELESRLQGQVGVADPSQESVRMILMGPPGAGTWKRWR